MCEKEGIFSKSFDMFVWTSGFQKSLAYTDFNMFVDEWTSVNKSPGEGVMVYSQRQLQSPLLSAAVLIF